MMSFECELAQENEGYESGSESLNIPTPLFRTPCLYHVSTHDSLSFGPATPREHSPHWPGNLTTVHCHLRFKEDDNSSIDSTTFHARTEHHSPVEHLMAHHLSSTYDNKEEEEAEHFPTAPLNDDVCMEEPVPDRHLYIHEDSQHNLCPYPCPYSLDQPHLNYALQYIWTSATCLISKIWQQLPVTKIFLTWKMFSNFNIECSLNRLVNEHW